MDFHYSILCRHLLNSKKWRQTWKKRLSWGPILMMKKKRLPVPNVLRGSHTWQKWMIQILHHHLLNLKKWRQIWKKLLSRGPILMMQKKRSVLNYFLAYLILYSTSMKFYENILICLQTASAKYVEMEGTNLGKIGISKSESFDAIHLRSENVYEKVSIKPLVKKYFIMCTLHPCNSIKLICRLPNYHSC